MQLPKFWFKLVNSSRVLSFNFSATENQMFRILIVVALTVLVSNCTLAQEESTDTRKSEKLPGAMIDGSGPDWTELTLDDFINVNCKKDTWSEKDGVIKCNGNCVGVIRSKEQYQNFEMVLQWKHLKSAGNSGVFVWSPKKSLDSLKPETNGLPHGIEVQVLDLGYTEQYEKSTGKKADWFTCHGDVFPVGSAKMKPFKPVAPNGKRSFPSANHSKGVGEWNHYYIRAINGEVRLWVNGYEVSGGNECEPSTGFIALEAEGAPIHFKNIRLRKVK
jgi:hypothetical protein